MTDDSPPTRQVGLVLDRYEVVRRLAVGGMGEVFLAVQRGAGDVARTVILKAMLPQLAQDPASVRAFLDEARVIATLNHPNVVSLYEVGVWQGLPLIAMEFVRGRTVSGVLRSCEARGLSIPPEVALTIARDAARGLHHAHQAKDAAGQPQLLIHRDISPQNIMVRLDGVSKVLDFGIAHTAVLAGRTATGLVKGKLAYMPPEQALGERLDQRVDQFALGIVLWELLTQRRLYSAENEFLLAQMVQTAQVPRASSLGAPPACDALLTRMLSRLPDQRFLDCGEVAQAIDVLLDELGEGETAAVAALMATLGDEDLDAAAVPSLVPSLSPLPERAAPRTDVPAAIVAGAEPLQPLRTRWLTVAGVAFVLVVAGVAAGGWWWTERTIRVAATQTRLRVTLEQNAHLTEKTVEGFCADSARIMPRYRRVAGPWQRSAADYLEPRIGWKACPGCDGSWKTSRGSLAPPQGLVDRAQTYEDAGVPLWRSALTREDLSPLDFRWLEELQQFDHWWLSEHPRTKKWHGQSIEAPLPNHAWLQWWVKFRFAQALLDDDLPAASAQVAHLRALLRSQGTLIAEMTALAMLTVERAAIDDARHRGLNTDGLIPLSQEQVAEIRSIAFASRMYAWPGVSPAVMARAYACSPSPCVMLAEAAWLRAVASDLAPNETGAAFEALLQRAECDQETLRRALQPIELNKFTAEDLAIDPLKRIYEKL